MRLAIFTILILLMQPTQAQVDNYKAVITNINVIDIANNKILPMQNVLIGENKITISSDRLKDNMPKKLIDGTNKYFMPSMWDMHVHFPDEDADLFFKLQTLAGITNVRIMKPTDSTISFAKKTIIPQTMKIAYNFFGNEKYPLFNTKLIIDSLKTKGYHFIKIFGVKDEAQFDAIMSAAKKNKLIVCGHALTNVNPKKVLASGYKSIEHVGYFDRAKTPEALDSLIEIAKQNNVYVCPTLDWSMMVYHSVPQDSLQYRAGYAIGKTIYGYGWDTTYKKASLESPAKQKEKIVFMRNNVAKKIELLTKLKAAGIKIIAGSDAEEPYQTPGFSLIEELKWIKKAGFTNNELLKMVTIDAASFFPESKNAPLDYLLLSKNPIEDIGNLESVDYVITPKEIIDCIAMAKKLQKTKRVMLKSVE